jgi:hypothetical protein
MKKLKGKLITIIKLVKNIYFVSIFGNSKPEKEVNFPNVKWN